MQRTHGMCTTQEYKNWFSMKSRCTNQRNYAYRYYGGRGITVCDEWMTFEPFLRDMGRRPSPQHSLDRIDNDGPYCRENCRWATRTEQMHNTRSNRWFELNGQRMVLQDWARQIGASYATLYTRLARGWPVERALTLPPKIGRNQHG
ncbi:MAG TPA: hypothetical protein DCP69_09995 [Candidatus Omnitrophica bacterium]|nr:hypothetical protein [Candidatus Omnitrophota bacterium]